MVRENKATVTHCWASKASPAGSLTGGRHDAAQAEASSLGCDRRKDGRTKHSCCRMMHAGCLAYLTTG